MSESSDSQLGSTDDDRSQIPANRSSFFRRLQTYRSAIVLRARGRLSPRMRQRFDSSDVAQEAMLLIARNREESEGDETSIGFYELIRRAVRDVIRNGVRFHRAKRRTVEREFAIDTNEDRPNDFGLGRSDSGMKRVDRQDLLSRAMTQLDETDRQIVNWRIFDSLTMAEIAERLNTTEEAAKKRYQRIVNKLKQDFKGYDLDEL